MTKLLIAALAMLTTLSTVNAAEITIKKVKDMYIVQVTGRIENDDDDKFTKLTNKLPNKKKTVVELDSEGGMLYSGLNIGIDIHNRKFVTFVPAGTTCTSACTLMWLAGVQRYVTSKSHIGFHAAADRASREAPPITSSSGNAAIGAYLARLGFSNKAIMKLTEASVDDMLWMNGRLAEELGITASLL